MSHQEEKSENQFKSSRNQPSLSEIKQSTLNPNALDWIVWSTPKSKQETYKPGQEVKKEVIYQVQEILNNLEDVFVAPRVRERTNFYFPVLFRKLKCRIYVPQSTELFGLLMYKDPKSTVEKYSIHLCMDDSTNELKSFHCLMEYFDKIATMHYNSLKAEDLGFNFNSKAFRQFRYYSPLRENRKDTSKPNSLRVKVPCRENVLLCQLYNGDELLNQDMETFKKYVVPFCKVKCIIEVNPIWYGTYTDDYKYGISYKLIAIRVERPKIEFKC